MDETSKTEIVYSARLTERELNIFERLLEVAEDIADAVKSQPGLEGGKSLLSTLNRAFDQIAFHHEASTRHVETSAKLNETYIELLRKQVDNQEKQAKSIEEVRKAQAGQSSAIQSLDKRLKNIEGGRVQDGGGQRAPFRDEKNRSQSHRFTKASVVTTPAAPTTSEGQNANKDNHGNDVNSKPAPNKENSEEKQFADTALQEQVQKLSVA